MKGPVRYSVIGIFALSGVWIASVGCGRSKVESYRIPKKTPGSAPTQAAAPAGSSAPMAASRESSPIQWKTPAAWESQGASGMRVASFSVPGKNGQQAQVTIIPLAGMAGGDLENVNRWRGQIGLPSITDSDLAHLEQTIKIGSHQGKLFDLAGGKPMQAGGPALHILAATLSEGGSTWFFKMMGTDPLVEKQKPTFIKFLSSVQFQAGAPMMESPSPAPFLANKEHAPGSQRPQWTVPANWKEEKPGAMTLASFSVDNDKKSEATINVYVFPGEVGGLLANVNRWRGQIKLDPIGETALASQVTSLDAGGQKAQLVDLENPALQSGDNRIVAAIIHRNGNTWFYKLMGPNQLVGHEKQNFIKFVKSVRYPNA